MTRTMKTTPRGYAVAGLAVAAMWGLTGCQQDSPETDLPPLGSESTTAAASSPSSSAAAPSASASPAVSSSAFPTYEPIRTEQPATDEEATDQAFETVELMYEVSEAALRSGDPKNAQKLGVATSGGMLEREMELVEGVLSKGGTYEGQTELELIDSKVFPAARQDGSLIDRATVQLVVCEDNSAVKITGKDGKEQNTGDHRFRVNYDAMWNEQSESWAVVSTSLPKLDGPEETQC